MRCSGRRRLRIRDEAYFPWWIAELHSRERSGGPQVRFLLRTRARSVKPFRCSRRIPRKPRGPFRSGRANHARASRPALQIRAAGRSCPRFAGRGGESFPGASWSSRICGWPDQPASRSGVGCGRAQDRLRAAGRHRSRARSAADRAPRARRRRRTRCPCDCRATGGKVPRPWGCGKCCPCRQIERISRCRTRRRRPAPK